MSLKETREGEREGPREGHTCLDSSSPPGNPRNEVKASDRRVVSSYVVRNVDAVAALFPRPAEPGGISNFYRRAKTHQTKLLSIQGALKEQRFSVTCSEICYTFSAFYQYCKS